MNALHKQVTETLGTDRWIVSDEPAANLKRLGFRRRITPENWARFTTPLPSLTSLIDTHYDQIKGLRGGDLARYINTILK